MDPFRYTLVWNGASKRSWFISTHELRTEAIAYAIRRMRKGHRGKAQIFVGNCLIWQRG